MAGALDKLLEIGGPSLGGPFPLKSLPPEVAERAGPLCRGLQAILARRNGFFAFESALRIFPVASSPKSIGLLEWNSEELWRSEYNGFADEALFFAEDVFGVQFAIRRGVVCRFEPETGSFDQIADTLEGWAERLLEDWNYYTGHSLAHEWQKLHGVLPHDKRLLPLQPFVCDGAFEVANLRAVNAVNGMKWRGHLATQIRDLPDGAQIKITPLDDFV